MTQAELPRLIADEIRACQTTESELRDPDEMVRTVTTVLMRRTGLWTKANKAWALRVCVRDVVAHLRHADRPSAAAINARTKETGVQRSLPGWSDLLKWRIVFDDGLEVSAAYATLAQIEFAAGRYEKLGRENITKGQYLAALAGVMRASGFNVERTVAEFYKQAASA